MGTRGHIEAVSARALIDRAYAERKSRRPKYSLRAFARDLGVSHTLLSLIRNGRYQPSSRACMRFSEVFGDTTAMGVEFRHLADAELARGARRPGRRPRSFRGIAPESVGEALRWYDLALLDLTGLSDFEPSAVWCAQRLGLSVADVRASIRRLFAVGWIDGTPQRWRKSQAFVAIATPSTSLAWLRSIHEGLLGRALMELGRTDDRSFQRRDITASLIPVDPTRLPEVRRRIQRFRRQLIRYLSEGNCTELYALNVQLFPLTQESLS